MNDELEAKRKMEERAKAQREAMEKAKREAQSALNKIEKKHNPPPAAPVGNAHRTGLGGATAQPGEISALWWLNMGL